MQICVPSGRIDMPISIFSGQNAGAQSIATNENILLEVGQSENNLSFINIFIQGKSQNKELSGNQGKKNILSPADDSYNDEDKSADLLADAQAVQLFAVTGLSTDYLEVENLIKISTGTQIHDENAAVGEISIRPQANGQKLEECAKQVEAIEIKSSVSEKIVETLRSMNGGDTPENDLDETPPKKEDLSGTDIADDISPALGMTYGEKIDQPDSSEIKSCAVQKALNSFIDDLSSVGNGDSEIRIELEPETLGALTISVSRGANGVSAKIISGDRETCAIIADQIQRLILSMEDKGIIVENVDVIFGQMEQEMSFAQNYHGNSREFTSQNSTTPTKEKTELSDRAAFFEAWNGYTGSTSAANGATEYRI